MPTLLDILASPRSPRILRSLLSIKIISVLPWTMSPMQQKIFTLRLFWLFVPILLSVSPISSDVVPICFQIALVSSSLSVISSFPSCSLVASLLLKPHIYVFLDRLNAKECFCGERPPCGDRRTTQESCTYRCCFRLWCCFSARELSRLRRKMAARTTNSKFDDELFQREFVLLALENVLVEGVEGDDCADVLDVLDVNIPESFPATFFAVIASILS